MARRLKLGARVVAVAAVAGLLALLVWKIVHQNGGAAKKVDEGKAVRAPGFTLPRLDRPGELSLASLRGKAVVLNFWASWCIPCKDEAPALEAAWRSWRARGVVVVGIDQQDFKGDARRFMARYKLTYPVVHDGSGAATGPYGLTGVPETFFVNRTGKLVGHIAGGVSDDDLATGIQRALSG